MLWLEQSLCELCHSLIMLQTTILPVAYRRCTTFVRQGKQQASMSRQAFGLTFEPSRKSGHGASPNVAYNSQALHKAVQQGKQHAAGKHRQTGVWAYI